MRKSPFDIHLIGNVLLSIKHLVHKVLNAGHLKGLQKEKGFTVLNNCQWPTHFQVVILSDLEIKWDQIYSDFQWEKIQIQLQ